MKLPERVGKKPTRTAPVADLLIVRPEQPAEQLD